VIAWTVRAGEIERFEAKYEPEPNSGCWLWTGFVDPGGYGRFSRPAGQTSLAHRVCWEFFVSGQPVTRGLVVMHSCDVPACVNPRHLSVGTQLDNVRDRDRKGRGEKKHQRVANASGTLNGHAKLNPHIIREIRERAASGEKQSSIGKSFGILQGHVSKIVLRKVWRSVA